MRLITDCRALAGLLVALALVLIHVLDALLLLPLLQLLKQQ